MFSLASIASSRCEPTCAVTLKMCTSPTGIRQMQQRRVMAKTNTILQAYKIISQNQDLQELWHTRHVGSCIHTGASQSHSKICCLSNTSQRKAQCGHAASQSKFPAKADTIDNLECFLASNPFYSNLLKLAQDSMFQRMASQLRAAQQAAMASQLQQQEALAQSIATGTAPISTCNDMKCALSCLSKPNTFNLLLPAASYDSGCIMLHLYSNTSVNCINMPPSPNPAMLAGKAPSAFEAHDMND